MRVDTTAFEFSNNKKPFGWGFWWFELGFNGEVFHFCGLYSQAKKAAIKTAREKCLMIVRVMP